MKTRCGVMVASLALVMAAFAGTLDKKAFEGELKAEGGKGERDRLVFQNGKFSSATSARNGFGEAPYTATEKDGVVSFTASSANDKGETMQWTGTVKGDVIEATAVHKTSAGETTYRYTGAVKAKTTEKKPEHPEHPR